jgi:hypothetical protein
MAGLPNLNNENDINFILTLERVSQVPSICDDLGILLSFASN